MAESIEQLGRRFDQVAQDYQQFRPAYPKSLFDELNRVVTLRDAAVLEIGCGTGQASRSLLERHAMVTAIEPGPAMAKLALAQLSSTRFTVHVTDFEAWDAHDARFDLVVCATAFHWVDPVVRWQKSAKLLRENGALALVTSRTVAGGTFDRFYDETVDLHQRYAMASGEDHSPEASLLAEQIVHERGDIARAWRVAGPLTGSETAAHLFEPSVVSWFPWRERYTAHEAVGLLSTYSQYLAIDEGPRRKLLKELELFIEREFAGELTRHYLTILCAARRRSS